MIEGSAQSRIDHTPAIAETLVAIAGPESGRLGVQKSGRRATLKPVEQGASVETRIGIPLVEPTEIVDQECSSAILSGSFSYLHFISLPPLLSLSLSSPLSPTIFSSFSLQFGPLIDRKVVHAGFLDGMGQKGGHVSASVGLWA